MGGKNAAEERAEDRRGGCFGKLLVLFVLVLLGGFATALFFIAQAQDMTDIRGYDGLSVVGGQRDLKKVLENSIERGHALTLTEEEINRYIRRTLAARQGGRLSPWVELKGVAVRTEDERVEVVIERLIAGRPFTVSMYLSIEQQELPDGRIATYVHRHGGRMLDRLPQPMAGGRFGQVLVPQGFLLLVLNSFEQISALYEEELSLALEEMTRIRIGEQGVVLDPRTSSGPFQETR